MRKIFAIFKHDLKKIYKNVIAFIVIIGLSVLPSTYAWFNIASNWNPYDNSGNIPVAVVNLDKGCEIGAIKMSFGDEIVENLKKNTQMGWDFVDKETAENGVTEGDYYAAVIISEDFSENMTSIADGELNRPVITYVVNEKKNAIAPKITDKGIQAIETEVNSSFVAELTDIAATVLNFSSEEIGENKDNICDKIISALESGEDSLQTLKSTVTVVSDSMDSVESIIESGKNSLPKLENAADTANDFVTSAKDAVSALSTASTGLSSALDDTTSSLETLASSLSSRADSAIAKIKTDSDAAIDELQSLTSINAKIIEVNNNIIGVANSLNSDTEATGIASLISDIETCKDDITTLVASLSGKLDEAFAEAENDTSAAAEKLASITAINQAIIDKNNEFITVLNNLSEKFGVDTSAAVAVLESVNTKQNDIITKINTVADKIKATGELPSDLKSEIDGIVDDASELSAKLSEDVSTVVSNAKAKLNTSDAVEFLDEMNDVQNQITDKINAAVETYNSSGEISDDLKDEINSLVSGVKSSVEQLKSVYLEPLKTAVSNLADTSTTALDEVSSVLSSSSPADDISSAFDTAQNVVSAVSTTFDSLSTLLDNGIDNLDEIKTKVQNLKDNSTIEDLLNTIVGDPESISEFISSPVEIDTETVFPVSDYGSAMAPFYTVLALWVGGIVLVAVLKTDLSKKDRLAVGNVRPIQEYFGRYLIFLAISLLQATIVALGDVFFLGIQCESFFLFMLTNWITIIVFSLLIYSLTIAFSVIGKAVAVILLIIQVAGSGGTFPPELLPDFFQNLIRFMPFNYAINAMRETVAGVTYSAYVENILHLLCFIPVALVIGIFFRRPSLRAIKFFNKRLHETDLIL